LVAASSLLTSSSRALAARTCSADRSHRLPNTSAVSANRANATKIAHGTHLRSPDTLANSGPLGAESTIRQAEFVSWTWS
jgi:hypothetical protein